MPQSELDFRQLMSQVREGSHDAAWEIIEEYGPHIHRVVRRRLDRQMRQKYDSLDFLQSVWKSFFSHPSRMTCFEDPEHLIRYLVVMAKNKVVDELRHRTATQAYDVSREQSLEAAEAAGGNLVGQSDSPSQIAIARERWEQIMEQLPPNGQSVVEMRISGATFVEIADTLKIHERTARRVVEQLMQSLEGVTQ